MTEVMPQIEHVVMLMLENRSLDTVLGWLHEGNDHVFVVPAYTEPRFNGITPGMVNRTRSGMITRSYSPMHGTQDCSQPARVPRADPWELMPDVQRQMYGDENEPPPDLGWGDDAPMSGFAASYWANWDQAGEVMGAYTREQLPVLYGLAGAFAVSDAWFSSVPTATDPNRAFSICGTSMGATGDVLPLHFDAPTIFNGLDDAGVDWGIYWQYNGWLDLDITPWDRVCWTVDRFPQIKRSLERGNGRVCRYDEFFRQLHDRTLPKFSYLEPFWGWGIGLSDGDDFLGLQGNDYHPPAWVGPAESALNELYEALKHSEQWEHMLFIVTFDENGGTWDHVSPPKVRAPDDSPSDNPSFDFTRLGPRVPTLLVSPYVVPGTVFRAPTSSTVPFDHASVIKTILAWAGTSQEFIDSMGHRVHDAPLFNHALTDEPHLDNRPTFTVPPDYPDQGGPLGQHGWGFDIEYLPWDVLRALMRELEADASLGPAELRAALIERVRQLQPQRGDADR
jgi:phospholipase C